MASDVNPPNPPTWVDRCVQVYHHPVTQKVIDLAKPLFTVIIICDRLGVHWKQPLVLFGRIRWIVCNRPIRYLTAIGTAAWVYSEWNKNCRDRGLHGLDLIVNNLTTSGAGRVRYIVFSEAKYLNRIAPELAQSIEKIKKDREAYRQKFLTAAESRSNSNKFNRFCKELLKKYHLPSLLRVAEWHNTSEGFVRRYNHLRTLCPQLPESAIDEYRQLITTLFQARRVTKIATHVGSIPWHALHKLAKGQETPGIKHFVRSLNAWEGLSPTVMFRLLRHACETIDPGQATALLSNLATGLSRNKCNIIDREDRSYYSYPTC